MFHLLLILALQTSSAPAQTAHVLPGDFTVGKRWHWTYSSLDKTTNQWTPYFEEFYTVVERHDDVIYVEMSSHPSSQTGDTPAHHMFYANLADCVRAGYDPTSQDWTVQFFTRSLGGDDWELVSNTHPNLVFTEKFNCAPDFEFRGVNLDQFSVGGQAQSVFQIAPRAQADASWYFLSYSGYDGVAARKVFQPGLDYKFEYAP